MVERSASFKKPIKTNTDKEKQVFICFVRLSVFVGFSLFLLVFELKNRRPKGKPKATGRRDSGNGEKQ